MVNEGKKQDSDGSEAHGVPATIYPSRGYGNGISQEFKFLRKKKKNMYEYTAGI